MICQSSRFGVPLVLCDCQRHQCSLQPARSFRPTDWFPLEISSSIRRAYHNAADCLYISLSSDSTGREEGESARRMAAHLRPDPQLLSPSDGLNDMWLHRCRDLLGDLAPCYPQVQSAPTVLKDTLHL